MLNRVVIACDGNIDQVFFLMRQISYEIGFHTIHYKKKQHLITTNTRYHMQKKISYDFSLFISPILFTVGVSACMSGSYVSFSSLFVVCIFFTFSFEFDSPIWVLYSNG